jgi:hypothetical protein
MSYGILVKNSSGYIQIDDNYSNYTLIASGSVGVSASTVNQVNPATVYFTDQPSPVVVCVGNTGGAVVALLTTSSSSVQFVSNANITVSYRIYANVANNPGLISGYGLVVRNASSQVVFNSNLTYMRVGQLTFSTVGYYSMPTVYHPYGNAYVDITNSGSRAFLTIASSPGLPSYARGFGVNVGNGFWQYGQVVIWAAPGLVASGYWEAPNSTLQAAVLAA